MLETLQNWVAWLGTFARSYPAIAAIFISISLSWAPSAVWDQWFTPDGMAPKQVKRISLSITFIVAAVVSSVCWRAFVPADGKALVYVVSLAASFIAPFAHMVLASVLTRYVPWINLDSTLKKAV
jgi:hypothetical protein